MKRCKTLLVILLTTLALIAHAYAQKNTLTPVTISGSITLNEKPFPNAYIYLTSTTRPNVPLAYCTSNDDGTFSLSIKAQGDSLILHVQNIEAEPHQQPLTNRSQQVYIQLIPRQHRIEEVRVGATGISQKADTTSYIVASFTRAQDHAIADVIERMPGFSVSNDGLISYLGQAITNYYINGVDVLGHQYGIANKNIPSSQVSRVEVLHNHQSKKVLRGRKRGTGTAVNVVLKRDVSFTGNIEAGGGYDPPMGKAQIVPMLFSPKLALTSSCAANNIGIDLVEDDRMITYTEDGIENRHNNRPALVSADIPAIPNLPGKYALNNNSQQANINVRIPLREEESLRIKAAYSRDLEKRYITRQRIYNLPQGPQHILDTVNGNLTREGTSAQIDYKINRENDYLANSFSYAQMWDHDQSHQRDHHAHNTHAHLPHLALANSFKWLLQRGSIRYGLEWDAHYKINDQKAYIVSPILLSINAPNQAVTQHAKRELFGTRIEGEITYSYRNFSIAEALSISYSNSLSNSNLSGANITDKILAQKIRLNNLYPSLNTRLSYSAEFFEWNLNLPIKWNALLINDLYNQQDTLHHAFPIEPYLTLTYTPIRGLDIKARASYERNKKPPTYITPYYELSGLRSLIYHAPYLKNNEEIDYSLSASYRNARKGLFLKIAFAQSFEKSTPQIFYSQDLNGLMAYSSLDIPETTITQNVNGEVSWYILALQTTINLSGNVSWGSGKHNLDPSTRTAHSNLGYDIEPSILVNPSRFFNFQLLYRYVNRKREAANYLSVFENHNAKADLYITPHPQHIISANYLFYTIRLQKKSAASTHFLDLSYKFILKKVPLTISLELNNLLNQKSYTEHFEDPRYAYTNQSPLRPRHFLLSLRWVLG